MRERVPMDRPMIATGDIAAAVEPSPVGRRFSLDVAEDALHRIAPAAVEHIAKRLAEQVVYDHESEIRAAVHSFILDRAWAEPIIERAIQETVRAVIREMLAPGEPKGERG